MNNPFYKKIAADDAVDPYPISMWKGKIVYMTPIEYIDKVIKLTYASFKGTLLSPEKLFEKVNPITKPLVKKYAKLMIKGVKFPIPYIKVSEKSYDGVHRVLAAQLAGYKKIPIFMMGDVKLF